MIFALDDLDMFEGEVAIVEGVLQIHRLYIIGLYAFSL